MDDTLSNEPILQFILISSAATFLTDILADIKPVPFRDTKLRQGNQEQQKDPTQTTISFLLALLLSDSLLSNQSMKYILERCLHWLDHDQGACA